MFTALSRPIPPQPPSADLRARLLATALEGRFGPFIARLAHERTRDLLTDLARPAIRQPFLSAVDLVHLPDARSAPSSTSPKAAPTI